MAVCVWTEMQSGMGCGMMSAILRYCDVRGIDDTATKSLFFDVMRLAIPKRKEK